MNDINSETSSSSSSTSSKQPWNIYGSSQDLTPNPISTQSQSSTWKSFGTSMNAISFGFVATAILISMFLIMAIFEHLFKPTSSFSSPQDINNNNNHNNSSSLESGTFQKLGNSHNVSTSYASDFSVVMPGHQYPTHIAQPAPLPCSREGIYWPPH
ncbi:uncharacterized protein LOC115718569 [Cannabis sativa]|uniref:uncharacterized protein LOC115718569 n=1 Tax=Cannabis sativa TaxID=3483 RepID=UPI0029CA28AD|nr:uncharacterized protein LOC115718569 [Cannabis sativa]XP_030503231.2 uncharacterized protein LOC115718569 [Cannabis sativa]XP_060967049.1 uncharacterized protein LOC115718569 [Cannabis sativa]